MDGEGFLCYECTMFMRIRSICWGCKAFGLEGSLADGGLIPLLFIIARIPISWGKEACMGTGTEESIHGQVRRWC